MLPGYSDELVGMEKDKCVCVCVCLDEMGHVVDIDDEGSSRQAQPASCAPSCSPLQSHPPRVAAPLLLALDTEQGGAFAYGSRLKRKKLLQLRHVWTGFVGIIHQCDAYVVRQASSLFLHAINHDFAVVHTPYTYLIS